MFWLAVKATAAGLALVAVVWLFGFYVVGPELLVVLFRLIGAFMIGWGCGKLSCWAH